MLYEIFQQYKKQILIVVGLLAVTTVAWASYQLYSLQTRQGKSEITVVAIPNDTKITLNNSQTIKPGVSYLEPGSYDVIGHKDGFEDFKEKITVTKNTPLQLNISLVPSSDEAKKWARDNQALYLEPEKEAGRQAAEKGEAFQKANPILEKIPYNDPYYTIGYKSPDDKTIVLTITATSALYRYYALQQIRAWGYDPADFKILYNNYESQL